MLKHIILIWAVIFITGCAAKPESIHLGKDTCDFCSMIITHKQFGGEIIAKDGAILKFDDAFCLASYRALRTDSADIKDIYLVNYASPHNFVNIKDAFFVLSSELHSPMGGNTAAFDNKDSASTVNKKTGGKEIDMAELFSNRADR